MLAQFYAFSKRANSTLAPTGTGTQKTVELKDATDILSPSIEMQTPGDPTTWNYCYLPAFSRYYHILRWEYYRGTWTAHMDVDVLASWKSAINATSAMVLFSSSAYNLQAMDNRIASTASYDRQVSSAAFAGTLTQQQVQPGGYFALTVIAGNSVWATGGATTYFLTYQQMQLFANELATEDLWKQLEQFFTNPEAGIIDCYYLPIDVSQYISLTTAQTITIGDYTFGATGKLAQATNLAVKSKQVTIDIPWGYNDFRRLQPYSELTLFVPFCGAKSLSGELLSDVEAILIDYSVDVSTGAVQAICYVKEEVLAEFSGNIRISLPIGQTQARVDSIIGGAAGAITAVGGMVTGNPLAIGAGAISAVSSIVTPAQQNICGSMNGSVLGAILGNDTSRWQKFRLVVTSRSTTDDPDNMRGTVGNVLCKVRQISGLSGYCQTNGFSVSASCTQTERDRINQLMDGGVYLQ